MPKAKERTVPSTTARSVNSGTRWSAGTYGRRFAAAARGRGESFIATAPPRLRGAELAEGLEALGAGDVGEGLAARGEVGASALDPHLRRAADRIVVRAHLHAVGPGIVQDEEVADARQRQ